jgi:non-homologous end joining protein Ku
VPHHGIVPRKETVRGYEIAKDEYVRFEPEELKALEQASSSALVIDSFVPKGPWTGLLRGHVPPRRA